MLAAAAGGQLPAHAAAPDGAAAVTHTVPPAEQRAVAALDHRAIEQGARPLDPPARHARRAVVAPRNGADGPAVQVAAAAPAAAGTPAAVSPLLVTGVLWPGAANANPNRQVGKLFFDTDPSPTKTTWGWCTATAVNSENKSTIIAAGHCVYDFTNRRWYTQAWFAPGFENGRYLGSWPVRYMSTTTNYYNYGTFADDMSAAAVSRTSSGLALVNSVGGHGIAFNQPVNRVRTSLGYPVTDSRWPGFTASGNDMYYCQGTDSYYSTGTFAGEMVLSCWMTGGASGGPWLTAVNANWLGTVGSVNSNKGGTGSAWAPYMFGPYFGSAELAVFRSVRAV